MTPFETVETPEIVAACDGNGPAGHPRVFLNLAPSGRVECPYCSRVFINRAVAAAGAERPEQGPAPHQPGDAAGDGNG